MFKKMIKRRKKAKVNIDNPLVQCSKCGLNVLTSTEKFCILCGWKNPFYKKEGV